MSSLPIITFQEVRIPDEGALVVLAGEGVALGPTAATLEGRTGGLIAAAAATQKFTGKRGKAVTVLAPRETTLSKLVVVGVGKPEELGEADWVKLGGSIAGALEGGAAGRATVLLERADAVAVTPEQAADLALGLTLRSYTFDRYKTRSGKANGEEEPGASEVIIAVAAPDAATAAWRTRKGAVEGVVLARDLVNEPANVLGTVELADRAQGLADLGVEVEVFDETVLKEKGFRALLGVAQGSVRPPRLVVMRWNGGEPGTPPVAFVGKGVVFDSGGISIKPAANMEDMKGDMGGAAAVVGAMHAIASRKARCNVVGVIGLVENMPDGNAQRPGDIVKSLSGQTIEIINTDAEGRLVLADALHYTIETYKPRFVVDLATLTGAVIVALGHQHTGLFSNDDMIAAQLRDAGNATGDLVWQLPLSKEYDKLMDSKVADMKNTGGRSASAITAAQFLKRFVGETPWVHLDIAGTAIGAPADEISRTFGSGYGVRLLDRLVSQFHEPK